MKEYILYKEVISQEYRIINEKAKQEFSDKQMFYVIKKFFCKFPEDSHVVFRGQNKLFNPIPSLYRKCNVVLNDNKVDYYNSILHENPYEFKGVSTFEISQNLEFLSKIQHYGYPTDLLDVTTNPFKALGFMVDNIDEKEMVNSPACIYVFKLKQLSQKDKGKKNKIYLNQLLKEEDLNQSLKYPLIIPVNNQEKNIRLHAQSGQFIWFSKNQNSEKEFLRNLEKEWEVYRLRIMFTSEEEVENIRRKLNEYKYSLSSLYPDLIKRAEYYKNHWRR